MGSTYLHAAAAHDWLEYDESCMHKLVPTSNRKSADNVVEGDVQGRALSAPREQAGGEGDEEDVG